ncbi:MAG: hypothetical protein NZL85_10315 [Fimbriimonadales bacterium]|nr:hypothetical protein [Fimbriimonadales bacterium]
MNLMDQPEQLWRSLARLTVGLTLLLVAVLWLLGASRMGIGLVVGVLTLGGIMAFYAWLVRRFAQPMAQGFRRMLFLSGMVKYPILILVIYLVVLGGVQMVLGFVIGVLLPLSLLTVLAIRANR